MALFGSFKKPDFCGLIKVFCFCTHAGIAGFKIFGTICTVAKKDNLGTAIILCDDRKRSKVFRKVVKVKREEIFTKNYLDRLFINRTKS